jgi:hypothetical protein
MRETKSQNEKRRCKKLVSFRLVSPSFYRRKSVKPGWIIHQNFFL